MSDEEEHLVSLASAERDQYFLCAPDKLALLVDAAGITPADHVVELGAGIGTVARVLPRSRTLTLVELEPSFAAYLPKAVPGARVIEGDARQEIRHLRCDVLLSNLPTSVTQDVIRLLPGLSFRTAVLAVGEPYLLPEVEHGFSQEVIADIGGADFVPSQPARSQLVKLTRRAAIDAVRAGTRRC